MNQKELNEKRTAKLKEIIKPIEEFMNEYCCPHDMLIIQQDRVELFSGELSFELEISD